MPKLKPVIYVCMTVYVYIYIYTHNYICICICKAHKRMPVFESTSHVVGAMLMRRVHQGPDRSKDFSLLSPLNPDS